MQFSVLFASETKMVVDGGSHVSEISSFSVGNRSLKSSTGITCFTCRTETEYGEPTDGKDFFLFPSDQTCHEKRDI